MKANTDEIIEAGKKIIRLSNEIDRLFDELYDNFNELFTKGYWQGISANKYALDIKKEFQEYKNFCVILKSYGDTLSMSGNELKELARKYQRYDKNIY